ncbi:MAG: carbohydrate ABC transporter permease [Ruminiclostridium sp.]
MGGFKATHILTKVKGVRGIKKNLSKAEPYLLLFPALFFIIAFMGYPLVESIKISFSNYNLTQPNDIYFNGLTNYIKLFEDKELKKVLWNTLMWVFYVVGAQFILGFALALLLNTKFIGKKIYQSFMFLPWAVACFLIGLVFKWMFNEHSGVVNDLLMKTGIISETISWLGDKNVSLVGPIIGMIWYGIPFFGIMILASLQSIPFEVFESAKVDGANAVITFFKITLPYVKPTLVTTLLLRAIWVFNSADMVYIMTGGGPANSSAILPLYVFNQAFYSMDFGYGSAIGILMMAILGAFAVLFLKITKYDSAGDF